jgi:tRNA(Ile)-lysidine synthase TilS/MesJ
MIDDGDKIAIGISGGKDSLTLLYALKGLQRFYPKHFELEAITVDLGFDNFNLDAIRQLCNDLDVPYTVVHTEIGPIVFEHRHEKNPCSLCAKMRKGALNDKAISLGCNKIAYGHHKDDLIETMMMSMIYEGRLSAYPPVTHLDRTGLTVIRPLMYMSESDVIGFRNKQQLPVAKSPCPANGNTRREYIKNLIRQINRENPGAKDKMFSAVLHGNIMK